MYGILKNKSYYNSDYIPIKFESDKPLNLTNENISFLRQEYKIVYETFNFSITKFSKIVNLSFEFLRKIITNTHKQYHDPNYIVPILKASNTIFTIHQVNIFRKEYESFIGGMKKFANHKKITKNVMISLLQNKTYHDPNYIPPNGKRSNKFF